jgi:uncharacterized protein YkwD
MKIILSVFSCIFFLAGCSQSYSSDKTEGAFDTEDPYANLVGSCLDAGEKSFISALNFIRAYQGSETVKCLPKLSTMALNHSRYLAQNSDQGLSHEEIYGRPGFTGETLRDRGNAAGIDRHVFWINEGLGGSGDPIEVLRRHINSVYHRSHLLSPGTKYLAYAESVIESLTWIDTSGLKFSVYPYDGMYNVKPSFDPSSEFPNPWVGASQIGNPISIHFPKIFDQDTGASPSLYLEKFELLLNGIPVEGKILSSNTDAEVQSGDAFFLPLVELKAFSRYEVEVIASYEQQQVHYNWSFVTSE